LVNTTSLIRAGLIPCAADNRICTPPGHHPTDARRTIRRSLASPIGDLARRDRGRQVCPSRRSIELPDGKAIYPPKLHAEPIDRVACALLDKQQPSGSRFLRLVGPPGTGTSQSGRAIAYRLWTLRGRAVETRRGEPFYGFAEMSGGPSLDEFTFRYPSRPRGPSRCPRLRVADVGRLEVHGRERLARLGTWTASGYAGSERPGRMRWPTPTGNCLTTGFRPSSIRAR
jgi:hypothetical protein